MDRYITMKIIQVKADHPYVAGCQDDKCQAIFSRLRNEKMALEEDIAALKDGLHELSLSRRRFTLSYIQHDEDKVIISFFSTVLTLFWLG